MNATRAEVLAAVNIEPIGITTAELAHKMRSTSYNVGSILSKLAAYGFISKTEQPVRDATGHRNGYIWKRRVQPCAP